MFKIMLCCSAGMSTSLLVRKMVDVAKERNLPVQIIPVQPINAMDYGMQRGDNVLDYALSLINPAQ